MLLTNPTHPLARAAAGGVLALSTLGLTACGETAGPETGTDVQDVQEADVVEAGPYAGPYDGDFYEGIDSYDGEQVTVSADVDEVLSPSSFVIAGTDDTTVDPLLVVSATEVTGLTPGTTVEVTGTVHRAFDLAEVEEELGVELDDTAYEEYGEDPYIMASSVASSAAAGQ